MTQLVTATGETNLPGIVRLSAGGRVRHRLSRNEFACRPVPSPSLSSTFRPTSQTPVPITGVPFPEYVLLPFTGGRVIANDGTALLGISDASARNRGYILKPGADPQPFPIADAVPLMIDAAASKVLYQRQAPCTCWTCAHSNRLSWSPRISSPSTSG